MREEFGQGEGYKSTWSLVWQTLGVLLGTATLVSLIKHGFNIELYGIPAAVLNHYIWMRDALFEPIVWVLRFYGLSLSSWLKDLITAYILIMTSHWRALNTFGFQVMGWQRGTHLSEPWRRMKMLAHSIIWPLRPHPVGAAPYRLRSTFDRDEELRLAFERAFRRRFVMNLGIIITATVVFLRAVQEQMPRVSTHLLTSSAGTPWTQDGFRASWQLEMGRRIFAPLKRHRLVFHGLRKSAVVMLLEAGCSTAQVQAITGQSFDMVEHYAEQVNQRKLARAAILKWEQAGR